MIRKFKKEDEEFIIFQEYWRLVQMYYEPEATDEYWENLLKDLDALDKAHAGNRLCQSLVLSFVDFISNKYRNDNSTAYLKFIKRVKYAYKEFQEKADENDKKFLLESLEQGKNKNEKELFLSIVEGLAFN